MAVGDYFQHTFDTSRDGIVNKNLHVDYEKYTNEFRNMGVEVDISSLEKSYRCSPTICNFITDNLGIKILSARTDETKIIFQDDQIKADEIYHNDKIVKLFYRGHSLYQCYSRNWGECKGENKYGDVCVVINKTMQSKFPGKIKDISPSTKNKLYVACTRAHGDLYFVPESLFDKYKLNSD